MALQTVRARSGPSNPARLASFTSISVRSRRRRRRGPMGRVAQSAAQKRCVYAVVPEHGRYSPGADVGGGAPSPGADVVAPTCTPCRAPRSSCRFATRASSAETRRHRRTRRAPEDLCRTVFEPIVPHSTKSTETEEYREYRTEAPAEPMPACAEVLAQVTVSRLVDLCARRYRPRRHRRGSTIDGRRFRLLL